MFDMCWMRAAGRVLTGCRNTATVLSHRAREVSGLVVSFAKRHVRATRANAEMSSGRGAEALARQQRRARPSVVLSSASGERIRRLRIQVFLLCRTPIQHSSGRTGGLTYRQYEREERLEDRSWEEPRGREWRCKCDVFSPTNSDLTHYLGRPTLLPRGSYAQRIRQRRLYGGQEG